MIKMPLTLQMVGLWGVGGERQRQRQRLTNIPEKPEQGNSDSLYSCGPSLTFLLLLVDFEPCDLRKGT